PREHKLHLLQAQAGVENLQVAALPVGGDDFADPPGGLRVTLTVDLQKAFGLSFQMLQAGISGQLSIHWHLHASACDPLTGSTKVLQNRTPICKVRWVVPFPRIRWRPERDEERAALRRGCP